VGIRFVDWMEYLGDYNMIDIRDDIIKLVRFRILDRIYKIKKEDRDIFFQNARVYFIIRFDIL